MEGGAIRVEEDGPGEGAKAEKTEKERRNKRENWSTGPRGSIDVVVGRPGIRGRKGFWGRAVRCVFNNPRLTEMKLKLKGTKA